eukprot:TRINITY_DN3007_c0_g1_i5.p1 TRINITY_DN3007_c0_g1~~TRINITY_DN3007_c0_g1_i5.p1  ORF type:complete len:223 (+),score=30.87 TRINITY_DN3007_c0_g1_i5:607-1275(+)
MSNKEMQKRAQDANDDVVAFVVPHHHSNFHDRHRSQTLVSTSTTSTGQEEKDVEIRIGLAGHLAVNNLFPKPCNNCGYEAVNDLATKGCSSENRLEPSPNGDCYASIFQRFDLAVAWAQEGASSPDDAKSIDNSAQRLLNFFSVGVPTIGHSNYASFREAVDGHSVLATVNSDASLVERLRELALNPGEYEKASKEALQIADLYSPAAIGRTYREVFATILG